MYSSEPKDILQAKINAYQEVLDWLENPEPELVSKQRLQTRLLLLRQEMFDTFGDDLASTT